MDSLVVLGGGPSPEHAVSLESAGEMLAQLRAGGHAASAVHLDLENRWAFGDGAQGFGALAGANVPRLALEAALERLARERPLVVVGLHGRFGEDGRLQRLLERHGLRFTGSGSDASAVGMDKELSKLAATKVGARCAAHEVVGPGPVPLRRLREAVGLPCFVKPAAGGSSVGVSRVDEEAGLREAVERARAEDPAGRALVEGRIDGDEVTCGALRLRGELVTLPLVAIRPAAGRFYDYDAKYVSEETRLECPADLPDATAGEIVRVTRALHEALGLRGMARMDFIVRREDAAPVFLELNTLPGFTAHSLVPRAAAAAGITRLALLEALLADCGTPAAC